jgi:ribosome-associated protein
VAEDLRINDRVTIPAADLRWRAVRSSGPGGQNVNKVSTKVELRFDLPATRALDPGVKARLQVLARGRFDAEGLLIVTSERTRNREVNLGDARAKLAVMILRALPPPKPRRPTKPSRAAKKRRLDDKKKTSARKKNRRAKDWD